jgi:hypothetical protein
MRLSADVQCRFRSRRGIPQVMGAVALCWRSHQLASCAMGDARERPARAHRVRRLGTVHRKTIFDIYAAMPSSWNTPRMAVRARLHPRIVFTVFRSSRTRLRSIKA